MQVTLIPFAILQDTISKEPFLLEYEKESTAEEVLNLLSEKYPKAAPIIKVTRLAHEDEYVGKKTILKDGAEYCLIPPVSGG